MEVKEYRRSDAIDRLRMRRNTCVVAKFDSQTLRDTSRVAIEKVIEHEMT